MRTERESCALYALRRAEKQSGFDPLTVEIFFHGNKNFRREVSWIFISPSLFPFFFPFFFFFNRRKLPTERMWCATHHAGGNSASPPPSPSTPRTPNSN